MKKNRPRADSRRDDPQLDKVLVAKIIATVVLVSLVLTLYQRLKRFEYFRVDEVTVRQGSNIIPDEKNFVYKDEMRTLNIYNKDGIVIYKI